MIVTGLSSEPLDIDALTSGVRDPSCGAVVTFAGTTRSPSEGRFVEGLSYEAWTERAEGQLLDLADQARARWSLGGVVAMHRVGEVGVGEVGVFVACSAPHRTEAFEAARWLIDEIKSTVAIWKKEIFADGEAWVGVPE